MLSRTATAGLSLFMIVPTAVVASPGLAVAARCLFVAAASVASHARPLTAAGTLQTPEQFIGFKVGADNKLARWDKIVEYMKLAAARLGSRPLPRARQDDATATRSSRSKSASPETLKNLDRYKQLERQAVLPGRRADRRASATRSSGRARPSCSSPAASTRPRSARRRWRWSWCTGSRPTTRRR